MSMPDALSGWTATDPCTPMPDHKTAAHWSHGHARRVLDRQCPDTVFYQRGLSGRATNTYMTQVTDNGTRDVPGATLSLAHRRDLAALHCAQLFALAAAADAAGVEWSSTSKAFLAKWAHAGPATAAERQQKVLADAERPLTWIPPAMHMMRRNGAWMARVLPGRLIWADVLKAAGKRHAAAMTSPAAPAAPDAAFAAKGERLVFVTRRWESKPPRVEAVGRLVGIYTHHAAVRVEWPSTQAGTVDRYVGVEGWRQLGGRSINAKRDGALRWRRLQDVAATEPELLTGLPPHLLTLE